MNTSTRSHELPLPGLREDNPRDFLAALGLLRLVDLMWPSCQSKLVWDGEEHLPTPVSFIHLTQPPVLPQ